MSFCLDVFKVNNLRMKTFEIEIHCLCLSLLPPKKIAELNVKRLSMLHTRKYKNSPQCQPAAIT